MAFIKTKNRFNIIIEYGGKWKIVKNKLALKYTNRVNRTIKITALYIQKTLINF